MPESRNGFTLAELLVALAIMATLGALVVPAILASVDRARINGAEDSLESIAEAVHLFQDRVQEYPRTVRQLVIPITTADEHFCAPFLTSQQTYTGGEAGRWAGPYLNRSVPAAGIPISIGTVQDTFTHLPDASGIDYLRPTVLNVLQEDAVGLDNRVDAGDGRTAGTIRWDVPAAGFTTLYYLIPYQDC